MNQLNVRHMLLLAVLLPLAACGTPGEAEPGGTGALTSGASPQPTDAATTIAASDAPDPKSTASTGASVSTGSECERTLATAAIPGVLGTVVFQSLAEVKAETLVGVAELDPTARGGEVISRVTASPTGALYAVIDSAGPKSDRIVVGGLQPDDWRDVLVGADDILAIDFDPANGNIIYSDAGVLKSVAPDGTVATIELPSVDDPFAMDVVVSPDGSIIAAVSEAVPGVPSDFATLSNLWSLGGADDKWTRLTTLEADEYRWTLAKSPVFATDGSLHYVVEAGVSTGTLDDIRTQHWVLSDQATKLVAELPTDTVLTAVGDGWQVTSESNQQGIWVVSLAVGDSVSRLGCFRTGNLSMRNGDPDYAATP